MLERVVVTGSYDPFYFPTYRLVNHMKSILLPLTLTLALFGCEKSKLPKEEIDSSVVLGQPRLDLAETSKFATNIGTLSQTQLVDLNKRMAAVMIYTDIANQETPEPEHLSPEDSLQREAVRALYEIDKEIANRAHDFARLYFEGELEANDLDSMEDAYAAYLKSEHNTSIKEMQNDHDEAAINVDRVFGLPTQKSPEAK